MYGRHFEIEPKKGVRGIGKIVTGQITFIETQTYNLKQ